MDCDRIELYLPLYLLGTLGAEPSTSLERHLDACETCSARLRAYGETATHLAHSLPRLQAPERIRQALMRRVDTECGPRITSPYNQVWRFAAIWAAVRSVSVSQKRSAALFVAMSLVVGGVWLNQASDPASSDVDARPLQLARLATRGSSLNEPFGPAGTATAVAVLVNARRVRAHGGPGLLPVPRTSPLGTSLSMLRGTAGAVEARGVLIASDGKAILLALNLPPLAGDKVYQIWLVNSGNVVDAGILTVDATGYGQTVIIPFSSLADYDGIGITIEPARGSADPTGVSVLQGDL